MDEKKKCSECKLEQPMHMFVPSELYSGDISKVIRCSICRRRRRKFVRDDEEAVISRAMALYGPCNIRQCNRPRTKDTAECLQHIGINDEAGPAELIRLYSLRCIYCGWYNDCRGTTEQARITRLLSTQRCPTCNGNLELVDEGMIVGRKYGAHSAPIRKEIPATGSDDS